MIDMYNPTDVEIEESAFLTIMYIERVTKHLKSLDYRLRMHLEPKQRNNNWLPDIQNHLRDANNYMTKLDNNADSFVRMVRIQRDVESQKQKAKKEDGVKQDE